MKVSPTAVCLDALMVISGASGSDDLRDLVRFTLKPRLQVGDNYHEEFVSYAR